MLGRKTYTAAEIENGHETIHDLLSTHDRLVTAFASNPAGEVPAALNDFDPLFFNGLVLVLDRLYVHRVRLVTGKDNHALNEVELLADSLLNHGGVFNAGTVVKCDPSTSVVGLAPGDAIRLSAEQFRRLAEAFFAELEKRFAETD